MKLMMKLTHFFFCGVESWDIHSLSLDRLFATINEEQLF